ncbi:MULTISPECIES: lasso peptide biosynthesis B2 protein [unclassified Sphingomonas]|uniref:lasso peptide biosynthesis B2 protein n=1 Tax=unclassified Sphingomonas TaxID=196159 RepID=UPI002151EE4E|nr:MULTISPECIES: lasso peptide biosynthesis B2 protein [unclassified Sphingomonas]MCR5869487.1 lasso peptide biosynthesis B2 protein [Sphingomonas sp. J344]UUX98787.1 lasso peptide biosynthesis B2 protein [Sphingomonas sp. J315]
MLRKGLSFCITSGEPVFLDTLADRYFCLAAGEQAAFLALLRDPADPVARHAIATVGLLEPDIGPDAVALTPAQSVGITASLLDAPGSRTDVVTFAHAGIRRARTAVALRRSGLGAVLSDFAGRKRRMRQSARRDDEIAAMAQGHERLALITASLDQCLPRSLALAHHLVDRGHSADLVLAVHLRPFKAHCWVQVGELLVNDRSDTVAPFTPILVL